jgi:hypothetical protein
VASTLRSDASVYYNQSHEPTGNVRARLVTDHQHEETVAQFRSLLIHKFPRHRGGESPRTLASRTSGIEQWSAALASDWIECSPRLKSQLPKYNLVLANLNFENISCLLRLSECRPPRQKWVSIIEGDGLRYLDPSSDLISLLGSSDLVITINQKTLPYFQALTLTPCSNIGVPYPVAYVKSFATPIDGRESYAFVCPSKGSSPSRIVAERLGIPTKIHAKRLPRNLRSIGMLIKHRTADRNVLANIEARKNPNLRVTSTRELQEFWKEEGRAKLWVNLDPRYTWGRLVLDAACLGVPIITTASTCHGERLFPGMTVANVFCVEEAIEIGRRLVEDESYYRSVLDHAQKAVEAYRPEVCVHHLLTQIGLQDAFSSHSNL